MLELMPAPLGAKPELAQDVDGNFADENRVGKMAFIIVENSIEYDADLVVEQEMERVYEEFPVEVDAFLEAYSKAREYSIATHIFGLYSWN